MSLRKAGFLIALILIIDQVSKIYIKTNFTLGEEVFVFEWFRILFVENEGMAWGMKLPGSYGKLLLTLFRLVAIVGIGYWLYDSIKKQLPKVVLLALCLVFAGALGNIVDSVFYGLIFDDSLGKVASIFPEAGGYASLFHGKVVDMLYFPIWSGYLPEWIPFKGGDYFVFFEPVFNIADTSISIGIGLLLLFNKSAFPKPTSASQNVEEKQIS